MAKRKPVNTKAATAIIAVGLASAFVAKSLLVQLAAPQSPVPARAPQQSLLLRQRLEDVAVEADAEHAFDPDSHAYLIVHYHKTGHHLSRQLRDFLVLARKSAGGRAGGGTPRSNGRENAFHHRSHEGGTGCPRAMELSPGVVAVQAAPDLFCDAGLLAEYLLRGGGGSGEKRGVKVVHLVRDPFDLAVSNYLYHAQYPTPEPWVKTADPCAEELWDERDSLGDLVGPALMTGEEPVMRYEDLGMLNDICMGIYQNCGKESKGWSYYTHLRQLDARKALSLATTHMMIQGISGGDILRMANNVVKLNEVQQLEARLRSTPRSVTSFFKGPAPKPQERARIIDVMTLSMKDFKEEPYASTLRFLDFALEDAVAPEAKERIASEYERAYNEKLESGNEHITADKEIINGLGNNIVDQKLNLIGFLRRHKVFGRVLGNIEQLVKDALRG